MRKSHVMERKANSDKKPRITSFNIRCGEELKDPMDPSKGKGRQRQQLPQQRPRVCFCFSLAQASAAASWHPHSL